MIPITIWIVEDDSVYRRSLEFMLAQEPKITCAHKFSSCLDFFKALQSEPHPDLVLMDLGLPEMSGVEGIQKLAKEEPDIAVLVLTTFAEKKRVMDALEAGAAGYLLKTATGPEIIKGIEDVFMGQTALSPSVAKIMLEEMRRPALSETFDLSRREIEVLEQLAQDLSVKEIATVLGISRHTASYHLGNIYVKLQVQSQTGAVAKALRAGII